MISQYTQLSDILLEMYEFKKSKISGMGAFADRDIVLGETIGLAFTKIKNTGTPDQDYRRTNLGAYVNHSQTPNIKLQILKDKFYYIAIRNIPKGTELTINYKTFPWEGKREFAK